VLVKETFQLAMILSLNLFMQLEMADSVRYGKQTGCVSCTIQYIGMPFSISCDSKISSI
jgi:hypothetical protein